MNIKTAKLSDTIALYTDLRLIIIFFMGFVSGLPFLLTASTLSIWLTESGISLTEIGLFTLVGTPYNLKFLWAPFIDRVPVPLLQRALGRRRAWMLVIQILLMVSIIGLGSTDPSRTPFLTAIFSILVAFFSASQDIVIDAYRIDILEEDEQGAGAAMTQIGYRFGLLASGAGALYLASYLSWKVVYTIMALLIIIGVIAAIKAPVPETDRNTLKSQSRGADWLRSTLIEPFVEFFKRNNLSTSIIILSFILLYKFGDAFAGVMANPFYIKIGFTKAQIATVSKIFGITATLSGVFLGGILVKKIGILKSLFICGLLQMFSNLMFSLQAKIGPDVRFLFLTIGVENLSGGMGSAAFVAYLSILCNTAYTGTQYALFTSFMAFGRTWLSASSGWIAQQTDWVIFFIISTFLAIPGLIILLLMMRFIPMSIQKGANISDQGGIL